MAEKRYYGWDIGGAHLKLACLNGGGEILSTEQHACALWQGEDQLTNAMTRIVNTLPDRACVHAITMTGELCDNFANRHDGVRTILNVIGNVLPTADVLIYGGRSGWYTLSDRVETAHLEIASANWLATAAATALLTRDSIIVDVGSTTTDIVSISNHGLSSRGHDDETRLKFGELVYTGIVRTPLMAITNQVPFRGEWRSVAAEYFANMADVYRLTDELPDGADIQPSADGDEKTALGSARRVARMIGMDFDGDFPAIKMLAAYFAHCQLDTLQRALFRVVSVEPRDNTLVAAGCGAFVVRKLAALSNLPVRTFATFFETHNVSDEQIDKCAPAVAVAMLAMEERG